VAERQKGAARLLGVAEGDAALTALFAGFPDRYFAENVETKIAAHVRQVRARREQGKSSMIDVSHDPRHGMTELVVVAVDTPGLLADVAGVLYANRIEVVDAAIYSRQPADPKEAPEALDVFRVRDSMGRPVTAEARWTKVSSDLEAVVSGRIKAEILVGGRPRTESVASWKTPAVPTECKIDNIVSRDFTVVEVITEDRPGVLYAIARALFVAGLDIHRSKIATEANRAIDVFYVRDKATMDKIIDPERQASLRDTLLGLLASVDSPKLVGAG